MGVDAGEHTCVCACRVRVCVRVCVCECLTIPGDVQLHQLHEVGHLGGQSLDLIVAQAQFAQVEQPEERLGEREGGENTQLWHITAKTHIRTKSTNTHSVNTHLKSLGSVRGIIFHIGPVSQTDKV